jgi:hypothetical protein
MVEMPKNSAMSERLRGVWVTVSRRATASAPQPCVHTSAFTRSRGGPVSVRTELSWRRSAHHTHVGRNASSSGPYKSRGTVGLKPGIAVSMALRRTALPAAVGMAAPVAPFTNASRGTSVARPPRYPKYHALRSGYRRFQNSTFSWRPWSRCNRTNRTSSSRPGPLIRGKYAQLRRVHHGTTDSWNTSALPTPFSRIASSTTVCAAPMRRRSAMRGGRNRVTLTSEEARRSAAREPSEKIGRGAARTIRKAASAVSTQSRGTTSKK